MDTLGAENRMTISQKLMLGAQLAGMEAMACFDHIYTMPVLQTLGMPIKFSSLTGLAAGIFAAVCMPFIGWFVDQGSNPARRKAVGIVLATFTFVCGLGCIMVADVLHVFYILNFVAESDFDKNSSHGQNLSSIGRLSVAETDQQYSLNKSDIVGWSAGISDIANSSSQNSIVHLHSEVPFKAVLGMLGFIIVDASFEIMHVLGKSYTLYCCPQREQTSALLIGMLVASAGGLSTTAIGAVNVQSVLGLSYIEGGSIAIQTSVQASFVVFLSVVGVSITLRTGARQLRRNQQHSLEIVTYKNAAPTDETMENSVRSESCCGSHAWSLDDDVTAATSEQTPLMPDGDGWTKDGPDANRLEIYTSPRPPYGTSQPLSSLTSSLNTAGTGVDASTTNPERQRLPTNTEKRQETPFTTSFKLKVALVALSTYLNAGIIEMYTFTISDFIGKAVYEGNPHGLPGSDSLFRYQDGVRLASWGFVTLYVVYTLFNALHSRLLSLLGYRLEFVMVQLIMATSILSLLLFLRVELIFLTSLACGMNRACFFTLPYAVVNDIIKKYTKTPEEAKKKLGMAMSMVAVSLPLSYCTLFPWAGALEKLTTVAAPMWVSVGFCVLSAIVFVLVGKV